MSAMLRSTRARDSEMPLPHTPARPVPGDYLAYFGRYIERVPEGELLGLLATQLTETQTLLSSEAARDRSDYCYAPGKWTLKEVVGHMADTERVMSYRALAIARGETAPLPSFDENAYTSEGHFGERTLEDLLADFVTVRAATLSLFGGFRPGFWLRSGTASGARVTVAALAFIIAGHEIHHRSGILESYLG
jgi:hypothetical protein